jgi:hypothetical protein
MQAGSLNCALPECGKALKPPIQCSKCNAVACCGRVCQVKAWKAGHKREHQQLQHPQLQHKRLLRHRPQFHQKNMNWSSKRNERIGTVYLSICLWLSVPRQNLRRADHHDLPTALFETNATHGRRALTPEEQKQVLQDKEYKKFFGGGHRKSLVQMHEWPIERVKFCIKGKTEAFVQSHNNRHPYLADIASDIDWKHASERFDVLTCHYPLKAIVGSDHSKDALKRKFLEISQEQKYMTMKHLAQAVERVNEKKECKTKLEVDETKLLNTMNFLMQEGRLVQHHSGEQIVAENASSSTGQVDEEKFVRACERQNYIKHIVKFWRSAKQRRSAAEAMELCKKWISFPKEDQMDRFLELTNGISGQWVVSRNEVQCACACACRARMCARVSVCACVF